MKIGILSNVNISSIAGKIDDSFEVYKPDGYGVWVQEITDIKSALYKFKPEGIFLILDGKELIRNKELWDIEDKKNELLRNLEYIEQAVVKNKDIRFFISDIDIETKKIKVEKDCEEETIIQLEWLNRLSELKNKYSNMSIFPLKRLIEVEGRKSCYCNKLWYLSGIKFSVKGEEIIKAEIESLAVAMSGRRKKCLVLDLDNTLWGGIIAEVGVDGIELSEYKEGARYKEFQKRIKEIKDTGVLLCICSKNNEKDVDEVFFKHPHMVLKKSDFTCTKINWLSKVENIKKICSELNLGADSLVFIDDSPIERELVKNNVEGIIVPDFPEDTYMLEDFIIDIYNRYFRIVETSTEDLNRTEMYKENLEREIEKKETESLEAFLKNLRMEITVRKASGHDILRISQLTQRTNQFNLTNKRYTRTDVSSLIKNKSFDVFAVEVKDKFGDNGVVSVIIVERKNLKEIFVDTFLMSCRVMGRKIEEQLISFVEDFYRSSGFEKIFTYYNASKKNKPVEKFYENMGYKVISLDENGSKFYGEKIVKLKNVKRSIYGKLKLSGF
ncbi:FkbH-like protein [Clostridium acetobutylicum]|uniref:Uncharacterized conserved protein n=1 Tax=Clostridium acetobutylicum (strain ATCC 824 / DSM 792 / JCM 1419 / IAM 19013 / LMG 5710 / NBRC 13948 / NRRL B-527 / VKM B-1787 / 2291 / W) TaxID=272562 RepID=Q97E08_CLOAB|nr:MULTISPECIES: HAD family hydrolase [Clostridium]AAK81244.1 Uncharacterized conserved protein [Clostridium acetobutylicum ATCC 824]ADZ22352.1 Conserved hypothetical protein [Clostridium acetobutylicum EA 2018]AEI32762.1 hypothetical protein SMB_G3349 [Clostridium acetobutylicum DSM 1731]AWV81086.1 HAD-IIIC family phosphatase [Clostridium acetobutylicum]MBC2395604.1 HAD-IIIC family phosphatase [Clostridium acetobutylicum]